MQYLVHNLQQELPNFGLIRNLKGLLHINIGIEQVQFRNVRWLA